MNLFSDVLFQLDIIELTQRYNCIAYEHRVAYLQSLQDEFATLGVDHQFLDNLLEVLYDYRSQSIEANHLSQELETKMKKYPINVPTSVNTHEWIEMIISHFF